MDKFLITLKSGNRITGPIMVTTSPRATCPAACPFRRSGEGAEAGLCYAEHGHLGHFIWSGLDRVEPGSRISGRIPVFSLPDLLEAIRTQPPGALWRHNQAGDLPSIDQHTIDGAKLRLIVDANNERRGFTYTHYDVLRNEQNRAAIREANSGGFTINLSADTLEEADQLAELACAPVTVVLREDQSANLRTPAGRLVVICPARTEAGLTCATCGICAIASRKAIIGFPALGPAKGRKV